MQYEDRVTIPTPEGVHVEMTLAGIGSRFIAQVIDSLIKFAVITALIIALFGFAGFSSQFEVDAGGDATIVGFAVLIVAVFLINFGYDVLFETLASGKTPGKRWTGLRVVKVGGSPVGFTSSSVRNLLRIVDILPGAYGVGLIAIVVTKLNQRLGDVAAGTVVVRERRHTVPSPATTSMFTAPPPTPVEDLATWDVSAVTQEDLVTIRRFLERRHELTPVARANLAADLANRIRQKVAGAPMLTAESFLEQVSIAKAQRS
ncbi:MAG: RDD family protein [Actinomycetota bacterium]